MSDIEKAITEGKVMSGWIIRTLKQEVQSTYHDGRDIDFKVGIGDGAIFRSGSKFSSTNHKKTVE